MEEQKRLKKQFIIHIFYNMVAFAAIFVVFGIFMFAMVKNITFASVDKELIKAQNDLTDMEISLDGLYSIFGLHGYGIFQSNELLEYNIARKINNPQIDLILRNENGGILNENDLGRISDYVLNIGFDKGNLGNIYELKIGDKYNYRGLNLSLQNSQNQYIQLLINVDGETALVNSYFKIIMQAVFVGIILSGIASLILSNKTLKPAADILKKQNEFVQNVSHELRTPLTIIQAQQELLLQEPNSKIIDKSEEIILTLNETKRLSKLTKDLMSLLRGEDKTTHNLIKDYVNIDELIQNVVVPYIEMAAIQDKEILLNLKFGQEISIDSSKIHQLLIILLDNAIKYTENGDKIQINTYLKDGKCVIEVCDTGIGISEEGLKRVFDRFYREDRARNRETGGTGLGLSIAAMIVNSHDGTIKVSHNNVKGSVFIIKLPC